MIEITDYAYQILFKTLNDNLHISSDYGSPPIFYWYCKMIDETRNIENYSYLRSGEYKYKLEHSLGFAYFTCEYVGRQRYLIVTNYEINDSVLFTWQNEPSQGGLLPQEKQTEQPHKGYQKLNTKPLFGYSFVMNDRKEYNLIDKKGNLVTQWFRAIRPLQKPYGKYQIIAYINVGGYFCALGCDGKVYNMNNTWQEMYTENKNILNSKLFMNIITEKIENTMKTNKKVIRLTESDLHLMIEEAVREVLKETSLYYDEDNFSGRHTLTQPHPYIDDEGYLDNPNNYDDMDQSENEYSWDLFDNKPIATGVGGYYKVSKKAIPSEINTAIKSRKHMKNWDEKELKNRERMMKKWVKGKRNINDIEDTWADIH